MDTTYALKGTDLKKKFKNFELNVPEVTIPAGFATAMIGENGAGKTTLLNMMTGIRLDYSGSFEYFGEASNGKSEADSEVKNRIGYTGTDNYYLPTWTVGQIEELSEMLFDNFNRDEFARYCRDMAIFGDRAIDKNKKVSQLSDGTRTKLMLAGVLARDTDMLILDEPASPLDPLMRDKLCDLIREYIAAKPGRTVLFSTHNIMDMENVTDYAIIMAHGNIIEADFVENLKEKYILVKGEAEDAEAAGKYMVSISKSKYGFEGICLAENLDKLAGMDISTEEASLFNISVAIMKSQSLVR